MVLRARRAHTAAGPTMAAGLPLSSRVIRLARGPVERVFQCRRKRIIVFGTGEQQRIGQLQLRQQADDQRASLSAMSAL